MPKDCCHLLHFATAEFQSTAGTPSGIGSEAYLGCCAGWQEPWMPFSRGTICMVPPPKKNMAQHDFSPSQLGQDWASGDKEKPLPSWLSEPSKVRFPPVAARAVPKWQGGGNAPFTGLLSR